MYADWIVVIYLLSDKILMNVYQYIHKDIIYADFA